MPNRNPQDKPTESLPSLLLALIVGVPLQASLACLMFGWALSTLWGWFVVSAFEVAPLGIAQSAGVWLFIKVATYTASDADKDDGPWELLARSVVRALIIPPAFVAVGWVLKTLFM